MHTCRECQELFPGKFLKLRHSEMGFLTFCLILFLNLGCSTGPSQIPWKEPKSLELGPTSATCPVKRGKHGLHLV